MVQAMLRVRLGQDNTHYGGGLIPAAHILRLFADCTGEIGIRMDGVDGYLAAYELAEFFKPVYAGDYVEVIASLIHKGNRSRKLQIEARRAIRSKDLGDGLTGGEVLDEPELIAKAVMVAVVPKQFAQQKSGPSAE